MDDESLFRTIRDRLFTAVLGDVMDAAGLARQFLPAEIRALQPQASPVLVGRAMPVLEVDCVGDEAGPGSGAEPFGLMFKALDQLRPGEIYVATGGRPTYAVWGGLMSTRARSLGAVGAVLDGVHRDTREIRALGFPVFSRGAYAQDQKLRGRVVDFRCAVRFENGRIAGVFTECRFGIAVSGTLGALELDGVSPLYADSLITVPSSNEWSVTGDVMIAGQTVFPAQSLQLSIGYGAISG